MNRDKLNSILGEIESKLDDANWLSRALVDLSSFLIHSSEDAARADFRENSAALGYLDAVGDKKISVSESEKRAVVDTNNEYKQLTLEREGIIETINTIKKRVEVLMWERGHS